MTFSIERQWIELSSGQIGNDPVWRAQWRYKPNPGPIGTFATAWGHNPSHLRRHLVAAGWDHDAIIEAFVDIPSAQSTLAEVGPAQVGRAGIER